MTNFSPLTKPPGGLSIAAVERETGLSKDVLRIWERRYGFPVPLRTPAGERLYPEDQLAKLKLARRLMDAGMRPGRILSLSPEDLEQLARDRQEAAGTAPSCAAHDEAMELLKSHRCVELRSAFRHAILRDGLFRFMTDTAAPLTVRIGEAWMRGEIRIFEEHLFTEQLTAALRAAMPQGGGAAIPPRVLLTTLPGEQHGLGLLMAESVLRLEGADCVSLGTQTPLGEISMACEANQCDIVALSFSVNFPHNHAAEAASGLRAALPPSIALWCGGAGLARVRQLPDNVTRLGSLQDIRDAIAQWRGAQTGSASSADNVGRTTIPEGSGDGDQA